MLSSQVSWPDKLSGRLHWQGQNLECQVLNINFKGSILLLSMFVWPKMGYVRAKIGLTGQFYWRQPQNYLQPCCTGIAEVMDSTPIQAWIFSGFPSLLLK